MFEYTLLSSDDGPTNSKASLLKFESDLNQTITILCDPGWDGITDLAYLDEIIPNIDLILLSHPTQEYIGALPILFKKFGSLLKNVPIYTTLPISQLGKNTIIELYKSKALIGPYETNEFELKDIDDIVNEFQLLKHGQSITLSKLHNLKIQCYNAGHSLGGSFWSILNTSNEKIIYAPTWNHSKDSFLNGSAMLEYGSSPLPQLIRATTLITSSELGSSMLYKQRVQEFYQLIDNTIQRGGSVVLPTSVSGRMLELIHLVDDHLQHQPIPVILMSHTGTKNLSLAGNMLEWMSPQVIKNWEFKNQIPFDLSRVEFVDDINEIIKRTGSKIIFVSDNNGTEGSFSNELINRLSNDDKTTIILTEKSQIGSLGDELYQDWEKLCRGNIQDGVPVGLQEQIEFTLTREDPLYGVELDEFNKRINKIRKDKEYLLKLEEENKKMISDKLKSLEDEDDGDESEESEAEDLKFDPEALSRTQIQQQDQDDELKIDYDLRYQNRNRNKVFPFLNPKIKNDDYGDAINVKDFIKEDDSVLFKKKRDSDDEDDDQWNNKKKTKKPKKKTKQEEEEEKIVDGLDPLNKPRKLVYYKLRHETRCALSFIDLSGLVDLRSYLLILNQLKPKKIIIYDSFKSRSQISSIDNIKAKLNEDTIIAEKNKSITINNLITNIDIKLDESLELQLNWQKLNDGYLISHIIGELIKKDDEFLLQPLTSTTNINSTNTLNEINIGDLKLSELRLKLKSMGYDVVFKGEGLLSVNNDLCLIRRLNDDGDLIIDGLPNDEFYVIRKLINNMLAHV